MITFVLCVKKNVVKTVFTSSALRTKYEIRLYGQVKQSGSEYEEKEQKKLVVFGLQNPKHVCGSPVNVNVMRKVTLTL